MTAAHSPVSILFLVMSAKYRFIKYSQNCTEDNLFLDSLSSNIDSSETAYKTRVCNLLKSETSNSIARKNSLLWRIYLKSLLDVQKDFEKSRNALFAALDECPWNKVRNDLQQQVGGNIFKNIFLLIIGFISRRNRLHSSRASAYTRSYNREATENLCSTRRIGNFTQ